MAPATEKGMSEYELQRIKNMEENRRILESIRQEQLYDLQAVQPAATKKKKPVEPRPKKKARIEIAEKNEGSDIENVDDGRRKSSRLQNKTTKASRKYADDGTDDDDDNYESEEEYDDSDEEEDLEGRRKRKRPVGPRPKVIIPKNRENFYGAVPGVEIGRVWETRMECSADGIQRPPVAGIHGGGEGAYSIALSGGYEDDLDLGDCFTYTGEGGRELNGTKAKPKNLRTAPQSKDQTLTRGNLALSLNIESKQPVRVIRGYKLKNQFAPQFGYRYDGLYSVEKYWSCIGKSGYKVFKFALRRCPGQAPPPWVNLPQDKPEAESKKKPKKGSKVLSKEDPEGELKEKPEDEAKEEQKDPEDKPKCEPEIGVKEEEKELKEWPKNCIIRA